MIKFRVAGPPLVPITACIPTHPARGDAFDGHSLLGQAIASVFRQTAQAEGGISLATDLDGDGAGRTRQRALDAVETEWVSFLDSDDTWYPHHLATHMRLLEESGADVCYSWFDGNQLPGWEITHRGRVWNSAEPHHTTMTLTVRTELAKRVGFATDHPEGWTLAQEDWRFVLGLNELGAKFIGTGETTWTYRIHGGNTSGLPSRC